MRRRLAALPAAFLLVAATAPAGAADVAQIVRGPIQLNAGSASTTNQSNNWFGYDQGSVEQGGKLFTGVSATWTVPTARAHRSHEDEFSSTWVGIGGGCIDSGCLATDPVTLIQAGTEQDVSGTTGKSSYSTWWEVLPAPSIDTGEVPGIAPLAVSPGDRVHVNVAEVAPLSDVWTITITNLTTGKSWSLPTPIAYTSSHATAEWIEETPTLIGSDGTSLAALPTLSKSTFDDAKAVTVDPADGSISATPPLNAAERIELVEDTGNGGLLSPQVKVIAVPSTPDPNLDGFNACAWATSCSAPTSS